MTKRRLPTTAIPVNGPALRRLRMTRGIEVADLAARLGISRPYLTKIELGEGDDIRKVSPTVFNAIVRELKPRARRDLIVETPAEPSEMAESAA